MTPALTRVPTPARWVPTSYFAMGLGYVTITGVVNVMFKNLGASTVQSALWSSLLAFPYTFKFVWAPALELDPSRRRTVVSSQLSLGGALVGVAIAVGFGPPATLVVALIAASLLGATQDIACDGLYVNALDARDQARYTGLQSMCWKVGPIVAHGVLVRMTGVIRDRTSSYRTAWSGYMLAAGAVVAAVAVYHAKVLPRGTGSVVATGGSREAGRTFVSAFATFFTKKGIGAMVVFAFLYRLSFGLLDRLEPLFLIDDRGQGGLGLSNQTLSGIHGLLGSAGFMIGTALGGLLVARRGLERTLLMLCLCLNGPGLLFVWLARALPVNPLVAGGVVFAAKLGWGAGCVGQMIYMMQQIAPGPYRTAHFTFATAIMGACTMLTGAMSGYIERLFGYQGFFVVALLAGLPSLAATLAAPFPYRERPGRDFDVGSTTSDTGA